MRPSRPSSLLAALPALVVLSVAASSAPASAAASIGLGTSNSFAVLAGQAVTNTGPSVVSGDLGVSPGNAVTGFPSGMVNNGVIHTDAVALQAQKDLTTAYNDAAGRPFTGDLTGQNVGMRTLNAGVYRDTSGMQLTGTVTLDAQGDPGAVFVFQAGSTLTTASNSAVALVNGANPCNVFWQVSSSATLGTGTTFVGTVMALTSISVQTGATVQGAVLARNGQVSLDDNVITRPSCAAVVPTTPVPPVTSSPAVVPTPAATTPAATSGKDKGRDKDKDKDKDKDAAPTSAGPSPSATDSASSSGDDSSTTTGSTTSSDVPVPTGHPETGQAVPDGRGGPGGVWLLGAGTCALGAAAAAVASTGPRRRRSTRSS